LNTTAVKVIDVDGFDGDDRDDARNPELMGWVEERRMGALRRMQVDDALVARQ
jgi:hypothetical protein